MCASAPWGQFLLPLETLEDEHELNKPVMPEERNDSLTETFT